MNKKEYAVFDVVSLTEKLELGAVIDYFIASSIESVIDGIHLSSWRYVCKAGWVKEEMYSDQEELLRVIEHNLHWERYYNIHKHNGQGLGITGNGKGRFLLICEVGSKYSNIVPGVQSDELFEDVRSLTELISPEQRSNC
jgi:hypothetical protein